MKPRLKRKFRSFLPEVAEDVDFDNDKIFFAPAMFMWGVDPCDSEFHGTKNDRRP